MSARRAKLSDAASETVGASQQSLTALPGGWVWSCLGDICRTTSGGTPSRKHASYFAGNIPWVKSGELPDGVVTDVEECITEEAVKNSSAKLFPAGTLLIALYGATVGKLGILKHAATTNQAVCAIFPPDHLDTKYLFWYLRCARSALVAQAVGGAQPNISQGILRTLPIPVAPLGQQKQIVAEIEKQSSRLDEAVANLKRVKANLKRYKAAVLKAAVEGRLVETEAELARKKTPSPLAGGEAEAGKGPVDLFPAERVRAIHAHPGGNNGGEGASYETGAQLLQRILETRRSRWKGKGKYKEPSAPDTTDLPELPEGWVWANYGQVGQLNLGRQRAPRYHSGPNMRPYLRVQNVFEDRIDLSDVMEMDFPPDDFEKYQLAPGDLLLNEGQSPELLGRPAIYRGELPGACFTNTLIRFRAAEGVRVEFALVVSRHNMRAGRFVDEGTITTNIAHLSLGRLATVEFPLPPLAEQDRIVAEVDRRLSLVREVEAQADANHKRADRLRQSILRNAFSTESVRKS